MVVEMNVIRFRGVPNSNYLQLLLFVRLVEFELNRLLVGTS